MKTVKRLYDGNGFVIGTIREEELPSPTQVLVRFCLALAALGLAFLWLL